LRRTSSFQFPFVAVGLCRAFVRGYALARFRQKRTPESAQEFRRPRSTVRCGQFGSCRVNNQHHPHAHAPGYRAIRWNMDWITRPLLGFALGGIAILVLSYAPEFCAALAGAIPIPAAYEWHRMVGQGQDCRIETAATAVIVALSVLLLVTTHMAWPALLLVA